MDGSLVRCAAEGNVLFVGEKEDFQDIHKDVLGYPEYP